MRFEGIYTPLVTPFRADGAIDWAAWAETIEFQIARGVHGLIAGGSTGEFYALAQAERLEQFRRLRDVAGRRLPLLAGVNALNADECPAYAAAARAAGMDGLLVAAPPYSQPSDRELADHCLRIDRAAGLPVMLYNFPGRTGAMMGAEFLARVGRNPNFCAVKESSGDIGRVHLLAREFPQIQLSCGADDQALEFFAWGARSWVCAAANGLPDEIVALYRACALEGDFNRGREIMKALLPMMQLLERGGQFIQCVKRGCELAGIPGGPPRPPLRPISAKLRREVDETVAALKSGVRRALKNPPRPAARKK